MLLLLQTKPLYCVFIFILLKEKKQYTLMREIISSFTITFVTWMEIQQCIIVNFNMQHLEEKKKNWREKKEREGKETTKRRKAGRNWAFHRHYPHWFTEESFKGRAITVHTLYMKKTWLGNIIFLKVNV